MSMAVSTPKARDTIAPVPQHLWLRDEDVSFCCSCSNEFGLFTRRHHCRQCGRIYCSRCSEKRWLIEGQQSRVCESCFFLLTEAREKRLKQQHVAAYEKPGANNVAQQGEPDLMQQISNTMAIFIDPSSSSATGKPAGSPTGSSASSSSKAVQPIEPAQQSAMAAAQLAREAVERVIYHTASLCPKCSLIEKKGFDHYKPAQLFEQYRGIWLRLQCESHGAHITLICKERNFWWRCHSYQERWIAALKSSGLVPDVPASIYQGISKDMEDIGKMLYHSLKAPNPPSDNLPLSLELQLYVNGEFVEDADLDLRLLSFVRKFPENGKGSTFLLKLQGGLVEKQDIEILNSKILRLVAMASTHTPNPLAHPILTPAMLNCRILVDVTYERLVDLLLLDKSCFLKIRVLPCVRYFLGPGEEEQFFAEMDYLLSLIKGIQDLELVLSLSLEPPYPNMMLLIEYIKKQKGVIRFILLSRERSPRDILQRLQADIATQPANATPMAGSASTTTPDLSSHPETTDPYELLESLESGTQGLLRPSDFVPFSIAQIFEPILQAFGYGSYHINPSPFCGFVATLITTEKLQSIPITRLFDIEQLYTLLIPIAQKLKYGKEKPSVGIMVAKQIQKAMKACAYNVEVSQQYSRCSFLRRFWCHR